MEETKLQSNELANLQKELEKNILENEILKNKLSDLTKEMNQFTYIVSHDLQAPLRTITGFIELLERRYSDKLDVSAKQFIDFAVKGAARMKALIFDLLEYSRLSSDTKELVEVDLNVIIKEVRENFLPAIEETGAVVAVDRLPVVIADRKQMLQLFQNIFDNALKFRSSKTPEIHVSCRKEKNFWVIGVKDNGTGIDPAYHEKIFIVFRQLSADVAKYSGTGIGLAVCKKITELHGGTIWVESEVDKGSTFYFKLPYKTGQHIL